MLLTRKSSDAAGLATPLASSLVASLARGVSRAIPTMDRRAFLRRSGLGVGVGLAASQLTLVRKAQAADPPKGDGTRKIEVGAPCAATARWAARSTRSSRTACGCARSRCSTRRSTSARTARKAPRCASTATASTG